MAGFDFMGGQMAGQFRPQTQVYRHNDAANLAEQQRLAWEYQHRHGIGQFAPPAHQLFNATMGNMMGGLNTMNNLGNTIGNAFDRANFQSGQNLQARYGPEFQHQSVLDTNRTQERMQDRQLQSREGTFNNILPHIIAALSGGMGGMGGFRTDYGAGAQMGSQAQPTNTQQFKHPLLALLGG